MATNGNGTVKEEKKKLTPRQVVDAAFHYLQSVIPQPEKISNVRVEQLEPIEKNDFWKVVLSYDVIGDFAFEKKREDKEFKIDAYNGNVISMKIFERNKA